MKLLIVCQVVDDRHENLAFFVRWIAEFAKHAERVTVIANQVGSYSLPDNVNVYSLGKEKDIGRFARYTNFYSLISAHRAEYDAVFCHMNPEFVIAGAPFWKLWGKRIVMWYVHGTVSARLRLAVSLADAACTTDQASLRINSPKINRVGHGIDTEFFKPAYQVGHDEALIVSAGRIAPSKHVDTIIDAVVKVKEAGASVRASIIGGAGTAGDRAYEQELSNRAKAYAFIKMLGPQTQTFVRDALASADIFVNASTTGSMDKAVLEAAASGALPMSSNIAFKPMLEPYGLFVPAVTAEAFATAIRAALARPDRREVAEKLRGTVVREHNLVQCIQRVYAILERK